jgi:hypothetical protein
MRRVWIVKVSSWTRGSASSDAYCSTGIALVAASEGPCATWVRENGPWNEWREFTIEQHEVVE